MALPTRDITPGRRRPSSGTPLKPLQLGAGQERGLRPGTENIARIVGFGVAPDLAGTYMAAKTERLACLRHTLCQLLNAGSPAWSATHPRSACPTP
jgi:cysteine desulfurase